MDQKKYSTGSSNITVSMPTWIVETLNEYAIESHMTRNAMIRMAIEDMLKKANRLPK